MTTSDAIFKVSTPGKVILHGEHSVVYGKLAIAASLDLRTTVTLQERKNDVVEINLEDLKWNHKFNLQELKDAFTSQPIPTIADYIFNYQNPENLNHNEFVSILIKNVKIPENLNKNQYNSLLTFLYLYFGIIYASKSEILPLKITAKTQLSLGSGTGSSASFVVSLAGVFLHYIQKKTKKSPENKFSDSQLNLISKWGYQAEKIIHGNPSGIDNTVCTYGAMVSFRKGRAPFAVKTSANISAILIDTKVPKNTAQMVQKVQKLKARRPKIVDAVLDALEYLTDDALEVLVRLGEANATKDVERCYEDLKELSRLNHELLCTLGVSHPKLDTAVRILREHGLPVKLTGAGGGGFAVALCPPTISEEDISTIMEQLRVQEFGVALTKLGGDGVRIEV